MARARFALLVARAWARGPPGKALLSASADGISCLSHNQEEAIWLLHKGPCISERVIGLQTNH